MSAALVTGASSGIGEQLARQLAARGHDLFLVARNRERLDAVAASLPNVRVVVHVEDLSELGAAERVVKAFDASGLELAVLVNNAGYGLHGAFAELDDDELSRMLMVNVVALQQLTRKFLPRLLARKEGGKILQLGSTAGMQPVPYMATYAATKAFVNTFSEALADELRDTNVGVTVVCPGPVDTGFAKAAGVGETKLFTSSQDAATVARIALSALEHRKALIVTSAKIAFMNFGARFAPRSLVVRMARGLMAPA